MKNILIAGGTGFIGKNLVISLLKEGHKVSLLTRQHKQVEGVLMHHWEPDRGIISGDVIRNQDIIINLSGTNIAGALWTKKRKLKILNSRINSTRLLINTIRENNATPELFINASAIGYYGNRRGEVLTEGSPPGHGFMADVCRSWESELQPLMKLSIPCAILRFGLVLSRHEGIFPILILPLKFGMNVTIGKGQQMMSWVHLSDLINCMKLLIDRKLPGGIYNCVAPNALSLDEINRKILKFLRKKYISVRVPSYIPKIFLGEMSSLLIYSQHVVPGRMLDHNFRFNYMQLEEALDELLDAGLYKK
jgi:uncharacterized protein